MNDQPTYGVVGVGSIASSIVTGLCDGVEHPPSILLSPRSADRAAALAARFPSARVAVDNQAVVDGAEVVLLCVLPTQARAVVSALRFRPEQAVVSAVAGVSLASLARWAAPPTRVARSIPLPAVASRTGVTPVCPPGSEASRLFDALGGSLPVDDESAFDAVAAASATVAAYFDYLGAVAGWLADAGVAVEQAQRYVASTFADLSGELAAPDPDFTRLAAAHTTPGGLNEQFARHLAETGLSQAVRDGLDAVRRRLAAGHD